MKLTQNCRIPLAVVILCLIALIDVHFFVRPTFWTGMVCQLSIVIIVLSAIIFWWEVHSGKKELVVSFAPLTIEEIRQIARPACRGSFFGVFPVNPPLVMVCVRDYLKLIRKQEIVHVDEFESSRFADSDAVHVVEKHLWAPPEFFQIVQKPKEVIE